MPRDGSPPGNDGRRRALRAAGACGEVLEELLAYGTPLIPAGRAALLAEMSFPDEPQTEVWSGYAEAAERDGAIPVLRRVLPQLSYPIRAGISGTEGYRATTLRGQAPELDAEATGLPLRRPEEVTLRVHPTLVGSVPILVAPDRGDFESLVRALSSRNEPVAVPPSMGACLVRGLNNWDRVRRFRVRWEAENPGRSWDDGFRELVPRKELYQDRFILLSTGPYSGLPAAETGLAEEEWLAASLSVRREHEMTHYFTLRVVGSARNNLVDELIADYVGLVLTFGTYRADLALRFFGLEAYPACRAGSRLEIYRGKPPLSDEAFSLARRLVHDAVRNLARLDEALRSSPPGGPALSRLVLELASLGLEELAGNRELRRPGQEPETALSSKGTGG